METDEHLTASLGGLVMVLVAELWIINKGICTGARVGVGAKRRELQLLVWEVTRL